jgi:hypothetical protein
MKQHVSHTMYSMHRQFFNNPMYYMDDPARRGGHLSADRGHRSRVEDGGTLQNEEDKGRRGASGGAKWRRQGERATRAAHRRLKVRVAAGLGGGGQHRRLRRPVAGVGGEANRNQGRGQAALAGAGGDVGGGGSV